MPRIVSFLPAATEMVCTLGLADSLVGITHECDYPPEVKNKPVVVRNVLPVERMSQLEIDRAVSERLSTGQSLYQIDENLLQTLAPDLILTQNLCQVCAPSGNEVAQVLKTLPRAPQVVWMSPQSLEDIFANVLELGAAANYLTEAEGLIDECRRRLTKLSAQTEKLEQPRVFCMEWFDPIYASGHWVPEMVKIAGGNDELARAGAESVRISWDELSEWQPEILILMPCGFNLQQTMKEVWKCLGQYSSISSNHLALFQGLPAVLRNRVYAVDANSYFARPGPRVVEGTELLAHLIHPEVFGWPGPKSAYQQVDVNLLRGSLEEGRDFYTEGGAMVFTSSYLERRGYCCDSGCRNCPYDSSLTLAAD